MRFFPFEVVVLPLPFASFESFSFNDASSRVSSPSSPSSVRFLRRTVGIVVAPPYRRTVCRPRERSFSNLARDHLSLDPKP